LGKIFASGHGDALRVKAIIIRHRYGTTGQGTIKSEARDESVGLQVGNRRHTVGVRGRTSLTRTVAQQEIDFLVCCFSHFSHCKHLTHSSRMAWLQAIGPLLML
jgi:hypothetical protein